MTGSTAARPHSLAMIAAPALAALCAPACANAQPLEPPTSVSEVIVVASSPLDGTGIDRDKAPERISLINSTDIARGGTPDALRALNEQIGAVNLDSAAGNPYQPTLYYHGFEASPLQGVAQGLAVYLNGVRFNQPFGDTVNWDLIPSVAIDRITVEGSNPVFGLNALGGSLSVQLKNGFTSQGGEADVSAGSFGQRQANVQYGARVGDAALYIAASGLHEDGWRDLQSSDIQSAYGDFGWRGARAEVHVSGRLASSTLNGPGSSPVELLAADPRAQFTAPNAIDNRYAGLSASGDYKLGASVSLQAVAYYDDFHQQVANGNAPNDIPCNDGSGLLCGDAGYSATTGGAPIPAFLGPSPFAYSELDNQSTATRSYGASVQAISTASLLGRGNHLVAGISYDGARTAFSAEGLIGGIDPATRVFEGPGVVIDEPGVNTPVRVNIDDADYGLFASDTLDMTDRLSVTASGRFNTVRIALRDQLGGALSGDHRYDRLNPALGAAWRGASWLTLYASYAEANRAPTPAELSCAGPSDACSLANFFVGDPDLRQVVARTYEAGMRGRFGLKSGVMSYSLGLYRTDLDNDIVFINSPTIGRAFFANIGGTRRQGLDADLQFKSGHWTGYAAYAHTEATYQSGFVESAGDNPGADLNGNLTIRPGDRLPGAPADQIKLGLDVQLTDQLAFGVTGVGQTGAYLFGDEANVTPRLPGFFVVNVNASYQATRRLQLFVRVENLTNARYYTFGTFSPTGSVHLAQAPATSNPRAYSPAAPIGAVGGMRVTF
jgi:iron complex outermembrane receptor protein